MSDADDAHFDKEGKYLYFTASTDTALGTAGSICRAFSARSLGACTLPCSRRINLHRWPQKVIMKSQRRRMQRNRKMLPSPRMTSLFALPMEGIFGPK